MKKKWDLSILEIFAVGIISLILIILIIPGIMNVINKIKVDAIANEMRTLYVTAVEENEKDNFTVKYYCYRSDYGYPKTLDGGNTKSLQNYDNKNISYLVEFNDKGGAITLLIIKDKTAALIDEYVNEVSIDSFDNNDIIKVEKGYEILDSKCDYRVK